MCSYSLLLALMQEKQTLITCDEIKFILESPKLVYDWMIIVSDFKWETVDETRQSLVTSTFPHSSNGYRSPYTSGHGLYAPLRSTLSPGGWAKEFPWRSKLHSKQVKIEYQWGNWETSFYLSPSMLPLFLQTHLHSPAEIHTNTESESETETVLLPGMFTQTRIFFGGRCNI